MYPQREFSASYSHFQVISGQMTLLGCHLSLLQGFYQIGSQTTRVNIQRTAVGTPPVSGTFGLSFGNQSIHDIPFDVSASTLTTLLENNFVDEGGKHVCMR